MIETIEFDYGRTIGVAVTHKGERRTVKVAHPFADKFRAVNAQKVPPTNGRL